MGAFFGSADSKGFVGLRLAEEAARRDERFVRTVSSANTGKNSTVFTECQAITYELFE